MARKGLHCTMSARWEEITNVNSAKAIRAIGVPIYFFVGMHDMITPSVLVEDLYDNLDAEKGKELVIFENYAHWPLLEGKEKYQDLLV
jgi:pimeloyl-ACP methyl ester carboxylesterase